MTRPLLLVASAVGLALASLPALAVGEVTIVIVVSPDGSSNITVEGEGFVRVFNCVGVRVDLNAPGLSTTITSGRREATCSDPTPPGPQPLEAAAAEEGMNLTLLVAAILPGAGEPAVVAPQDIGFFFQGQFGENPSQVVKLGEPPGVGASPNFLP